MKNIFEFAEACLHSAIIDEKLALTHQAWRTLERVRPQFYDSLKKQMDIIPIF